MTLPVRRLRLGVLFTALLGGAALAADHPEAVAGRSADALAHDIFKQLIEINTTDSVGNITTAAQALAQRFLAAGFPAADVLVAGPEERKKNLVVRLRGSGNHRDLIDAEFVLNHDGLVGYSITSEHGVPEEFALSATEKMYADYQLAVTNRGGHSSLPRPDNAIYQLAQGLLRISQYSFPFELNEITRAYFERMAGARSGQVAADMRAITRSPADAQAIARLALEPELNSLMRTTCVATRLDGGHANNALPQRAQAVVNCRILPGHSKEEVRKELMQVVNDPQIAVRYLTEDGALADTAPEQRSLPPSPLLPQVLGPLQNTVAALWPGLPVVPFMNAGATDGIFTRAAGLPTYGVAGIAVDRGDVRAHGRDERVRVSSFYRGNEFFYRYLKAITAP